MQCPGILLMTYILVARCHQVFSALSSVTCVEEKITAQLSLYHILIKSLRIEQIQQFQVHSSVILRSPPPWHTCGPTSGRCTSLMPSHSPTLLIRWEEKDEQQGQVTNKFSGHYQHLQEPAGSQVSQEGRAGDSVLHNLYSLNAGCLKSTRNKGRGGGERTGGLEISKYVALRLPSHPKHKPRLLHE